jgi:hypothetical protein
MAFNEAHSQEACKLKTLNLRWHQALYLPLLVVTDLRKTSLGIFSVIERFLVVLVIIWLLESVHPVTINKGHVEYR